MADSAPLVLREFGGVIEVTPTALELKSKALKKSKPIRAVETSDEQIVALDALRDLKALKSGIETTRKAVKAPVLELGKKIDATAQGYVAEIDKEYYRLTGMINHFQRKQLELKQADEKKLQQEQTAAQRLREQANELRSKGKNDEADKLDVKAFDLEMTVEVAVVPQPDRPKGLVVRNRINFEVIDAIVFCQAYPQFWKWHKDTETLKLDRMLILDELNRPNCDGIFHRTRFPEELSQTDDARLVQPAGLRVFEETKAHIR